MSGVMSINGDAGGPPTKLGLPIGDLAGGLMATIAILSAAREREKTGEGQRIDISLHDSLTYLLGYFSGIYFMTGESVGRFGSAHNNIVPYGSFPASDGYVVIAAFTQGFWLKLCRVLNAPALADDPRFQTYMARHANRDACDEAVGALTSKYTVAELTALLDDGDVPSAPVFGIAEALENPQLRARDMIVEVQHPKLGALKVLGSPFKMSNWPGPSDFDPPPVLGEDTMWVLRDYLGYTTEAIARLQEAPGQVDRPKDSSSDEST
jgi:crotonobetainyl-CoA:carnitine CoA-transferase CaiB-like acyl-CoA transferase